MLGKLKKILDLCEKELLSDFSKVQIYNGNITLINYFHKLDNQYQYFRERATFEYSSVTQEEPVLTDQSSIISILFKQMHEHNNKQRQGQYNALAMIDSYFSRLEHLLVLAFPFVSYDRKRDNLIKFVGSIWSDKFRRVININSAQAKAHYDSLIDIKEKFRNTFAHGGFEKEGQSFYFHLDHIGIIPASMSGIKNSIHFNDFPIDNDIFKSICSVFDSFDKYLSIIEIPQVWKYVQSGLHLSLADTDLEELLKIVDNEEEYEEWISAQCYWMDQYENGDY